MPGKEKAANNSPEERRRNPSRPAKGMVGDIAAAFKKQMAAPSASKSPNSPANSPISVQTRQSSRNKSANTAPKTNSKANLKKMKMGYFA